MLANDNDSNDIIEYNSALKDFGRAGCSPSQEQIRATLKMLHSRKNIIIVNLL
jgi:hypothetical protein